MRISVKTLRAVSGLIGLVHLAALVGASAPSSAEDEPNGPPLIAVATDEMERWIPSLSAAMGLMIQESKAGFLTGEIQDPAWLRAFPAIPRIRTAASGTDRNFAALASFAIEFMTPGLLAIPFVPEIKVPGRPRLFVHGDVIPVFPPKYQTAKNGDPGPFELGFPVDNPAGASNGEDVILGQGGLVETRVQQWQFGAGAGIAFSADFWGRRLRIKPSFEYVTQEIKVTGEVRRATAITERPEDFGDLRLIILSGAKTKRYHGLGAGIEFELDTRRAGPVLLSVFSSVRGYRYMGDLEIRVTDRNSFDERALFRFTADRYAYRASVGVRVRFAPE